MTTNEAEQNWEVEGEQEPVEAPGNLQDLCAKAAALKDHISNAEALLKGTKEQYSALTDEILRTLELMEVDSIRAHGYLFFKETKSSVTTPKTIEDKKLLFDYLVDKGLFLEMASVNSQTLQSLYKDQANKAAKAGNLDFKLPGVGEPTSFTTLKLRSSK